MTELTCEQLKQEFIEVKRSFGDFSESLDEDVMAKKLKKVRGTKSGLIFALDKISRMFFDPEISKRMLVDLLIDGDVGKINYYQKMVIIDRSKKRILFREDIRMFNVDSKIVFPDNLDIFGDLKVGESNIDSLPRKLVVRGNLDIRGTKIKKIPRDIMVHKNLLTDPELKPQVDELKKLGRVKG
ncbi:hypothetical protein HON36_01630 [Candidatus Parcubacteria bacterium]|jgi:hypothetical protein|nr:hypothetical protein [Candidatus Parcubacteria bacterium]MBT7228094.1 hypothetical protein [Candidatus Parcubacteria bacterium]